MVGKIFIIIPISITPFGIIDLIVSIKNYGFDLAISATGVIRDFTIRILNIFSIHKFANRSVYCTI